MVGKMHGDDIAAIGKVLDLIRKSPPKDESWYEVGRPKLETLLLAWLKEQL